MKATKFFIAAMAAIAGLSACNKDNGTSSTGDAVLMVKLPDNIVTRSVEDMQATPVTATTVDNMVIFMLNNNSQVMRVEELTGQDLTNRYKRFEQVNSTITKVLVVANIPTAAEVTALKAKTTASGIKNYAFTAASQNVSEGIEGQILMGEATATTASDPDAGDHVGHLYKEAKVTLNSLTARMEIGTVKAGEGVTSVELLGVWVNNFYKNNGDATPTLYNNTATCWDVTPVTTGSPATTEFTGTPVIPTYDPAVYHDVANAAVKLDADSEVYAYQVFAGNLPHVILLVRGKYDEEYYEDDKKYFYGFVTFTSYKEGEDVVDAFEPNTVYKIGTGATGIEITGGTPVTPEPELNDFDLFVKCTIEEWTSKNVTPGI